MDPDCAICHAPATRACDCEANSLETAVRQAEARMLQPVFNEIRAWVRARAQDYILEHFRQITDRRKETHQIHVDRITQHAYHYYNAPPHPSEIDAAQAALRSGINDDWQSAVRRYPEVLHYFYSLVNFTLPSDDDPAVRDPPIAAMRRERQPGGKRRGSTAGGGSTTPTMGSASVHAERDFGGRRSPPVVYSSRGDRRTPGPPERRPFGRPPPPMHPASGYYGPPSYYG
ncbi:unnamed protein product [Discula destructiva]